MGTASYNGIYLKVAVKTHSHPPQPFIKCKSLLTRATRARRAIKMILDVRLDSLESFFASAGVMCPSMSWSEMEKGAEPKEIMHRSRTFLLF